ncbi:MAG: GYD domain-containing protein, partial [Acidobacteria bacterium]|nr:GYD domain-containing protein [Acidobacteriota bacterium]
MAQYLLQVAYTPEAWAGLIRNPQDRIKALQPVV